VTQLLNNDVLLNFLVDEAEEDRVIRTGTGTQKSRKGYIGHIVVLCQKTQQASTNNPTVAKIVESKWCLLRIVVYENHGEFGKQGGVRLQQEPGWVLDEARRQTTHCFCEGGNHQIAHQVPDIGSSSCL
jgi:hypothetical protein